MESQPQNPEFRNNPENFHPCKIKSNTCSIVILKVLKFQTLFSFCFQIEHWISQLKFAKCFFQNSKVCVIWDCAVCLALFSRQPVFKNFRTSMVAKGLNRRPHLINKKL